ncbi:diheme cytochrome c precursor [Stieleria bergensis]
MSDSTHDNERSPQAAHSTTRYASLCLAGIASMAIIGYVVGISDGAPQPKGIWVELSDDTLAVADLSRSETPSTDDKVIDAIDYWQIPGAMMGPTKEFLKRPAALPEVPKIDLFAKVTQTEAEKLASLKLRSSRRAYNGAPPIIPHAIASTNDAACYACHRQGMTLDGLLKDSMAAIGVKRPLRASVMSHGFLANCVQCHAAPGPLALPPSDWHVANHFVGLAAPQAGQRASPGAPPTIPHGQWMRQNCNACHGGPNGWLGLNSTHQWRTNCLQCHGVSAVQNQAIAETPIPMLAPLKVVTSP